MSLYSDAGTSGTLAASKTGPSPKLLLIGTSYKTADVGFREKFAEKLEGIGSAASSSGFGEFSVLKTCNRVELYCSLNGNGGSDSAVARLGRKGEDGLYVLNDADAIRHLFTVATGLDSVAVGEDQILRQVRSAGLQARASGSARSILAPLFDTAYTSGTRIRKEFGMAEEGRSLSELALHLAVERLGKAPSNVLVAGTGETAKLAALRLRGARVHVYTNRPTLPKFLPDSKRVRKGSLRRVIGDCDLVISATRRSGYVLSREDFPDVGRRVVLDLGFPRNVDPAVRSLKSVDLIDLDDVAKLASHLGDDRKLELVRRAVEAEAARFNGWLTATRLNPALASIYRWAEQVREAETGSVLRRLPELSARERRVVEVMSRRLVSRLMAPHAEFVKGDISESDQAERLRLLEKIFAAETPKRR